MRKVAFHTLGCKVNQYETEAMEELFENRDYKIVRDGEKADIYIINTCTVTNFGDRKSRQFIRRAKKLNPNSIIAVVGCYSQISPDEVEKIEGVDVIIGTSQRERIVDLCEEAKSKEEKINIVEDISKHRDFDNLNIVDIKEKTRANIKIQDGCSQFCSYCIIPYARGPIRSRDLSNIIEECIRLRDAGFKEIVLTGIHIASYGKDIGDLGLIDVIEEISKIEGIERIRLSSIEPTLIDADFMKRAVETGKLCDHFHLSLQSGSDIVLKRMNRKYTTEEYKNIVNIIRKYMPDAGITTDVIVGFPGETDEEFEETYNFVKEIGFSKIHVFKYSPREGTVASKMDNQIHGEIKQNRSERLIALGEELSNNFNESFLGKEFMVLYEEESKENPDFMEGYTTNYIRVKTKADKNTPGKILNTKLIEIEKEYLLGKIEEF